MTLKFSESHEDVVEANEVTRTTLKTRNSARYTAARVTPRITLTMQLVPMMQVQ